LKQISGDDLLSHAVARAVSSALRGLTAVFGMGTGVALSAKSPEKLVTGWGEEKRERVAEEAE
jgi:hypothetical protein